MHNTTYYYEMDGPYSYLIVEREFVNSRVPIVKIGCSDDVRRRVEDDPNGSVLLGAYPVQSAKATEDALNVLFGCFYKQRCDIGTDYYQPPGDYETACKAAKQLHFAVCDQPDHARYGAPAWRRPRPPQ